MQSSQGHPLCSDLKILPEVLFSLSPKAECSHPSADFLHNLLILILSHVWKPGIIFDAVLGSSAAFQCHREVVSHSWKGNDIVTKDSYCLT